MINKPPQKKSLFKKFGLTYLAILFILVSFAVGLFIGKKYLSNSQSLNTLINKDEGQPEEVDFSVFWDVYSKINEKFVNRPVDQQTLVYGAIKGLVSSIDDPYSQFLDPEETQSFDSEISGKFEGIGAEITVRNDVLTVVAPINGSPATQAGLKAGDKIIKIDGESTEGLSSHEAVKKIRGPKGSIVTLTVTHLSSSEKEDIKITRDTIVVNSVKLEFKENDIAYLKITNFAEDTVSDLNKAADEIITKNSKGIVLDLRNNPGGLLDVANNTTGFFLNKGLIVVTEDYKDKQVKHKTGSNNKLKDIPIVILQNGGSASASEILAGALRDHRQITIIGETSFGKGSVQEYEPLKNNSSLRLTVARWLTPNGTNINEGGISPDIEIELSEEDHDNDRDPQLDKALEKIKEIIQ